MRIKVSIFSFYSRLNIFVVYEQNLLAITLKCAGSSCLDENLLAKMDIPRLILDLVRIKYIKEILQL